MPFVPHKFLSPKSSGPAPRGGIRGPCPPKRVTVPATFHPFPSLLNLIDFESESETDENAHIRMPLHALASISNCTRSQTARTLPTWTPPPNVICAPPEKFQCPPWCRCPGAGSASRMFWNEYIKISIKTKLFLEYTWPHSFTDQIVFQLF